MIKDYRILKVKERNKEKFADATIVAPNHFDSESKAFLSVIVYTIHVTLGQ